MKRHNINFGDPQAEKLAKAAAESGIGVAEMVRRIVDEYFRAAERQKREDGNGK